MSVKLKATLPKDKENNGLDGSADVFLKNPDLPRVVLLVVQQQGYHHSNETGEDVPELRVLRAEPVWDAYEADLLVLRAQALSAERTGHATLPDPPEDNVTRLHVVEDEEDDDGDDAS
jgi:hypothetical protein